MRSFLHRLWKTNSKFAPNPISLRTFSFGELFAQIFFYQLCLNFQPEKLNPAKYRRLGSVGKSILLPFTWYWMRNFIEFSCLWIFAEKEKLNQSFEKVLMQKPDSRRAQNSGQIFWEKIIWWNFRGERERATELVSGHLRGRAPCRRKSTSKQAELSLISWIFPHHSDPIVSRVALPESFNQN